MGFNVHVFCELAAIHENFICENLHINGYARDNGQPNDDITHRKMALIIFYFLQALFSHFASSFTTRHFVPAGCGVCIPSFSVHNCGSVSDLKKVVPHSMAAAARKARIRKGTRD